MCWLNRQKALRLWFLMFLVVAAACWAIYWLFRGRETYPVAVRFDDLDEFYGFPRKVWQHVNA